MRLVLLIVLIVCILLAVTPLLGGDTAAGRDLFGKKCANCHGASGEGKDSVAKTFKVEMHNLGSKEVQSKGDADLKKAMLEGTGKMKGVKDIDAKGSDGSDSMRPSVASCLCFCARCDQTPGIGITASSSGSDMRLLAAAAAILELFAIQRNQTPPHWTEGVGPLAEPVFLVEAAERMTHLWTLCETQAPEPLRKRRLYAPPNFLAFA